MTSPLAAVLCEQLAMLLVTHSSDALPPKHRHLSQPLRGIKAKSLQDGGKRSRNMAPFVGSDGSPCPVDQQKGGCPNMTARIRFAIRTNGSPLD